MGDASPGRPASSSKKRREPPSPIWSEDDVEVVNDDDTNNNDRPKSTEDSASASTEEPDNPDNPIEIPDDDDDDIEAEEEYDAPERVRVLTWNVDMDTEHKAVRTRALISEVRAVRPDIVMLQEVTDEDEETDGSVLKIIQRALCTPPTAEEDLEEEDTLTYNIYMPHTTHIYFCVLLARRGLLKPRETESKAVAFPGSIMARGYISVEGTLENSGARVKFVTSHLESLKMGTKQRIQQFENILGQLETAAENNTTSIFGGDTNLRETEVPKESVAKTAAEEKRRIRTAISTPIEVAPAKKKARTTKKAVPMNKVGDAWIMAGTPADEKFTWDTLKNDNLDMATAKFKPRSRYDRVFLMANQENFPDVASYRLLGTKRLRSCGKFVSDHFGVLVDVDVLK